MNFFEKVARDWHARFHKGAFESCETTFCVRYRVAE